MIVPAIHEAATNYLWPGLQSTDNSGVYQNVLDGRSGGWWFGSGWCCSNPSKCYCVKAKEVRKRLTGEFKVYLGVVVLALLRAMFCSSTIRATRIEVNGSA